MFFALRKPITTVFTIFLPLVAKITVFTMSFGQRLAKTLVFIYAVFTMWQDVVFICEKDKKNTLYFTMFLLPGRSKNRQTMIQKRFKSDFQKHLIILASFFPAPDPQKRENTSRVKDFGGSAAGVRKAMAHWYTHTASPDFRAVGSAGLLGPRCHRRVGLKAIE